jgi:co-chaperonin GroES (HSP10)
MSIEPMRDYLLIKPKKNDKSAGGVILPGNRTCVYETSEVVSIGKDIKDVSEGDVILHYRDRKENEIENGCFLIQEAMVVAKIN